jgi:hypothetical protein
MSAKLSYNIKRALVSFIYKDISLYKLYNFLFSYKVYFNIIKKQSIYR